MYSSLALWSVVYYIGKVSFVVTTYEFFTLPLPNEFRSELAGVKAIGSLLWGALTFLPLQTDEKYK